jgi:dihydropyrimidinase
MWHLGVNSGRLTLEPFVALTSVNAAKVFNLWPRKGSLEVGADADVIVLDPHRTKTLSAATQHQNTDFSVWEGLQVKGAVVHTLARGRHVLAASDAPKLATDAIFRASRSGRSIKASC